MSPSQIARIQVQSQRYSISANCVAAPFTKLCCSTVLTQRLLSSLPNNIGGSKTSHRRRHSLTQPNRSRMKAMVTVRAAKATAMGQYSKVTTVGSNHLCNPTHEEAVHSTANLRKNPNKCWYQLNKSGTHRSPNPMFAEDNRCNPTRTTALQPTCPPHQCILTHQRQSESVHCQRPSAATLVHCNPTTTKGFHCSHRHLANPDRDLCCLTA